MSLSILRQSEICMPGRIERVAGIGFCQNELGAGSEIGTAKALGIVLVCLYKVACGRSRQLSLCVAL